MALSFGINTSLFEFTSLSLAFNNLYALALGAQTIAVPILIVAKLSKKIRSPDAIIVQNSQREDQNEGGEMEAEPKEAACNESVESESA